MILRFDCCVLDLDRRRLSRAGQQVHVEPQVFDLIACLAQSGGVVVSKDQLVDTVWRGLAVSDATISARISAARAALGDSGREQRIVKTVARRGFQFAVPVDTGPDTDTDTAAATPAPVPAQVPDVRYALSRDGSAIAYSLAGDGLPMVRIGHWMSHLELDRHSVVWGPVLARLEQNHRLLRYDLRGTGLSARDAPIDGIEGFVDDLEAVTEAAGLERFTLYAASQAGPVAVSYAARHPDRVARLVIIGGYVEGRVHRAPSDDAVDEETLLALIRAGWGKQDSAFMQSTIALFAPDADRAQRDDLIALQLATAAPQTAITLRQVIDRFQVADILPRVRAPTLVLHAEADAIHPVSQGQKLAAGIQGARFVRLQSRNHVLLPTDPEWERAMTLIERFVAS